MAQIRNQSVPETEALGNDDLEIIRAAADIVRIVGAYVPLRKAGPEYEGLCPFHREKTPSFRVNGHKRNFYCHGCGTGGDVFRFVELIESVPFRQAKAIVAEQAGIVLSRSGFTPEEHREYRERRILADESEAFWCALSMEYSDLAATVYGYDQAACRWMQAHQNDPGVDDSSEARLCWLIFQLTPHADQLESEIMRIRRASPKELLADYTSFRDHVPLEIKQVWAREREIDADITAYIVAQIAFSEIGASSVEAA